MHPVAFKGFLTHVTHPFPVSLYSNSSMQLFFHLTLVSAGRRSGGMLLVTQCWSFPEGSTPAPPTPWWLWLPGTAHSPPYWSLEGGRGGRGMRGKCVMWARLAWPLVENILSGCGTVQSKVFTQDVLADGKGGFGLPEGEEYMFSMLPLFRADHRRRCL